VSTRDPFHLVGSTIDGKYRVDRVVGEGGLGVVYAGEHLLLRTKIAIKCLKPLGGAPDDEARLTDMFLREARVLFSLTHPSVVRLFDVGALTHPVPVPYVVLELIEGPTLENEVTRRAQIGAQLTIPELLAIFEPVLEGVAFAHQNGVVHRDLKPSNVMLVRSSTGAVSAKVVDFGIARRLGPHKSTAGLSGFTPRYAAPEQWDQSLAPTTPATDVFSLGLMIAEACTFRAVFLGGPAQIFAQTMDPNRRVMVTDLRRDLPPALDAILERCTRISATERFGNAGELLHALRDTLRPRSLGEMPAITPAVAVTPHSRSLVDAPTLPAHPHSTSPPRVDSIPEPVPQPGGKGPIVVMLVAALIAVGALVAVAVWLILERKPEGSSASAEKEPSSAAPTGKPAKAAKKNLGKYSVSIQDMEDDEWEPVQKDIAAIFRSHVEEVRACYGEAIERDAHVGGGAIRLYVEIDDKGKTTATCAEDSMADPSICKCIRTEATAWKFPKKGTSYFARYRFQQDTGAP